MEQRVTRARAAAKVTAAPSEPATGSRATRLTAAARAKAVSKAPAAAAAAAPTTTTSNKRKARADDDDDDGTEARPAKSTRGRNKKDAVGPEQPPAVAPKASTTTGGPRGRPRKIVTAAAAASARPGLTTSRARAARRTAQLETAQELPKKTAGTRNRAGSNTAPVPALAAPPSPPARVAAAAKTGTKKTVTFQEPEKENVDPVAREQQPAVPPAGTLRSRPARKPAADSSATSASGATARATRAARTATSAPTSASNPTSAPTPASGEIKVTPLSPKKVTQMPLRESMSEDELARPEKTPLRSILKGVAKRAAANAGAAAKKPTATVADQEAEKEEIEKEERGGPVDQVVGQTSEPVETEDMEMADEGAVVEKVNTDDTPLQQEHPATLSDDSQSGNPAEQSEHLHLSYHCQIKALPEPDRQSTERRQQQQDGPIPIDRQVDVLPEPDRQPTDERPQNHLSNGRQVKVLPDPECQAAEQSDEDGDDDDENMASEDQSPRLASPAKRPPPSPYKNALKSPAKRIDGFHFTMPGPSSSDPAGANALTAGFKSALLQTPAKRPTSASPLKIVPASAAPSFRPSSFFGSPAKRPMSAMRPRSLASPTHHELIDHPAPPVTRTLFSSLVPLQITEEEEDEEVQKTEQEHRRKESEEETGTFPTTTLTVVSENTAGPKSDLDSADADDDADAMAIDDGAVILTEVVAQPSGLGRRFGLRQNDLQPAGFDDEAEEDEDELAAAADHDKYLDDPVFARLLATPTPANGRSRRRPRQQASVSKSTALKLGFTPLADKFGAWGAAEPATPAPSRKGVQIITPPAGNPRIPSPGREHYFEDEVIAAHMMSPNLDAEMLAAVEADIAARYEQHQQLQGLPFDDVTVTDEDMDLAAEAREMSLLEPGELTRAIGSGGDDDGSEPSQEYADENQMPIDPSMAAGLPVTPEAPRRVVATRTVHTVSKVPLKPAADGDSDDEYGPAQGRSAPATPIGRGKGADAWLTTPRRPDLNPGLLRGAVAYVDVRTSDGADASSIFVELLAQMGARCVRKWTWSPSSSRADITHVVYKDGTAETLEKLRESGGVVQCVGVSWVLDCERENQWLDEAPYHIDASDNAAAGRDAHRRRRSSRRRMSVDPRQVTDPNGILIKAGDSPISSTNNSTPMNRRDSSVWVRSSPEDGCDHEDDGKRAGSQRGWDLGSSSNFLTPVPATPAPDAVARYAAQLGLDYDRYDGDGDGDYEDAGDDADEHEGEDDSPLGRAGVGTKTCPPKPSGRMLRDPLAQASGNKDESVLMRLLAARRKSLQFAPKISSPLARGWK